MQSREENKGSGSEVSRNKVNIYKSPEPGEINTYPEGSVVTVGDLHGNAAKFLHILAREGIIDISDDNYNKFINIYKSSDIKDINYDPKALTALLQEIKLKEPHPKLRLIGDDLADRGKNDVLTLLIMERLHEAGMNIEIIASNHGVEFLKQYSNGITGELRTIYQGDDYGFGTSLHGLRRSIRDREVTEDHINSIIKNTYLPNTRLMSYMITHDKKISIYSHAPINEEKISAMARLMKVPFKAGTVEELANTIDNINQSYSETTKDNDKLKKLVESNILEKFINDRYVHLVDNDEKRSYVVTNIHGHVGKESLTAEPVENWSYSNLDSDLGKIDHDHYNTNDYLAFVSLETKVASKLQASVPEEKSSPEPVRPEPAKSEPVRETATYQEAATSGSKALENVSIGGHLSSQIQYACLGKTISASSGADKYIEFLKTYSDFKRESTREYPSLGQIQSMQTLMLSRLESITSDRVLVREIRESVNAIARGVHKNDVNKLDNLVLGKVLNDNDLENYQKNVAMISAVRNQLHAFEVQSARTNNNTSRLMLEQVKLARETLDKTGDIKDVIKILDGKLDWNEDLRDVKMSSLFSTTFFSPNAHSNEKAFKVMKWSIEKTGKELNEINKRTPVVKKPR